MSGSNTFLILASYFPDLDNHQTLGFTIFLQLIHLTFMSWLARPCLPRHGSMHYVRKRGLQNGFELYRIHLLQIWGIYDLYNWMCSSQESIPINSVINLGLQPAKSMDAFSWSSNLHQCNSCDSTRWGNGFNDLDLSAWGSWWDFILAGRSTSLPHVLFFHWSLNMPCFRKPMNSLRVGEFF